MAISHELHWLPCEAHTCFKISLLCYVFKCFNCIAPAHLSELLVVKHSQDLTINIPRAVTSYGDRSFSCAGPRLWNALPVNIRLA